MGGRASPVDHFGDPSVCVFVPLVLCVCVFVPLVLWPVWLPVAASVGVFPPHFSLLLPWPCCCCCCCCCLCLRGSFSSLFIHFSMLPRVSVSCPWCSVALIVVWLDPGLGMLCVRQAHCLLFEHINNHLIITTWTPPLAPPSGQCFELEIIYLENLF